MQSLVRAAATMDAHLWAQCVSKTDRPAIDAMLGPQQQRHLLGFKKGLEARFCRKIGDDLFEYVLFQTIADVTGGNGLPEKAVSLAHILEERIWDNRYAEVTLILPFEVRGFLPPMTFYFLEENGQWRLCRWFTTALMLGWNTGKYQPLDPAIGILLKAHADLDLDRGNCTALTQRTFPLPEAVSAAYRAAVQNASARDRPQLLFLWALTGD